MDFKEERPSIATVETWDVDKVGEWLKKSGCAICVGHFKRNAIDGFALVRLSEEDLRRKPMSLDRLGDIKRIIGAIDKLVPSRKDTNHLCPVTRPLTAKPYDAIDGFNRRQYSTQLKPEVFKTMVAGGYAWLVFYICAVIMTVVNERVPDMKTYPPLPDLFLDMLPFIPWAFHAAEYICLSLFFVFSVITFTHKHRTIILRRYFSLVGTLFLLRGICMLITSLSVPCRSFKCQRYADADLYTRLWRAWEIMRAGGMALNGVRYCGDYMFSGHTTLLTLLSLFIDEYSDRNYPILKTFSWVLTIFGIFLVMAGHEHYSIDVFIAFYLTTRLFLYYHTLADNKAQLRYDERKVRIWFPLFSYFESEINGAVPHEYDWPLRMPDFIAGRLFGADKEHSE